MKKIQLTQRQFALVDDKDFERLNKFKWFAFKAKKHFYAVRRPYIDNDKGRKRIWMHHEVIGKPSKGFEIDHKNGKSLDNQQHNLRFVTRRQNQQNRKNQHSSSRYPGVCWDNEKIKWMAQIQINGKNKYLGRFIDEFNAFQAYKQVVKSLGEKVVDF